MKAIDQRVDDRVRELGAAQAEISRHEKAIADLKKKQQTKVLVGIGIGVVVFIIFLIFAGAG